MNARKIIQTGICALVAGCATVSYQTKQPQYICSHEVYNCSDFSTYRQALAVYQSCGGVQNDVHHLDRDKNGIPCESLKH